MRLEETDFQRCLCLPLPRLAKEVTGIDSKSANVWGRTLAATGGTLGLLMSPLLFGHSGQLSLLDNISILFLAVGSLLGVAGGFVPKVNGRIRGGIMLAGAAIVLATWETFTYSNMSEFATSISSTAVIVLYSWTALIIIGGALTLLSAKHTPQVEGIDRAA